MHLRSDIRPVRSNSSSPRPSYWAGVRTSWAPTSRSAHAHKVACCYIPTILSFGWYGENILRYSERILSVRVVYI